MMYRKRPMRVPLALALAAVVLGGCAKFPENGANNNFTRLSFRFRLNGAVNPNYVYIVAIRAITPDTQDVDTRGPIPVVTTGSKNGFVEGSPTHYVQYDEGVAELYNVFRFLTKAEAPDPSDDNPINLGAQAIVGPVYANTGVDPRPTVGGGTYGDTLGFDIDTRYLANNDADARAIVAIQFNILTMNRKALAGGDIGSRVFDAFGDTRTTIDFNSYRRIPVVTSGVYQNSSSSIPEPSNDTFNGNLPPVDIVDWSLEVRTQ